MERTPEYIKVQESHFLINMNGHRLRDVFLINMFCLWDDVRYHRFVDVRDMNRMAL